MAGNATKANCYYCGKLLTKTSAKRHLLTHEYTGEKGQKCALVRVESPYMKEYWLYVDIPLTSTLNALDGFLRDIWLECCGHMSAFYASRYDELGMNRKISSIPEGSVLGYEYDFGSTTELKISFVGYITRRPQKKAVRLLARNEEIEYECSVCGKPAAFIDVNALYEDEDPFLCEECEESAENEESYIMPVVNSPRMGVCGYEGNNDIYKFDPNKLYENKDKK